MGELIRILDTTTLSEQPKYQSSVRIESAECIHFHWRDMRIVMDPSQFVTLIEMFSDCQNWQGEKGEGDGLVLSDKTIPNKCENTIRIEVNRPEVIHLHIGDIRFEMTKERFLEIAHSISNAAKSLG